MLAAGMPVGVYAAEAPEYGESIKEKIAVEGAAVQEPAVEETSVEEALGEGGEGAEKKEEASGTGTIEINQGLGRHTGLQGGEETLMNTFVANRQTAALMKIDKSEGMTKEEAKSAAAGYRLEVRAVKNGDESDRVLLSAGAEDVCRAYDINSDPEKGWYAVADIKDGVDRGTYCFHYMKGNEEVGRSGNVTFYGTEELNILVLPVKGYWSRSCNYDPDKGGRSTHGWMRFGRYNDAVF